MTDPTWATELPAIPAGLEWPDHPDDVLYLAQALARVHLDGGDSGGSVPYWDLAIAIVDQRHPAPGSRDQSDLAHLHRRRAQALDRLDRIDEALEGFRRAEDLARGSITAGLVQFYTADRERLERKAARRDAGKPARPHHRQLRADRIAAGIINITELMRERAEWRAHEPERRAAAAANLDELARVMVELGLEARVEQDGASLSIEIVPIESSRLEGGRG